MCFSVSFKFKSMTPDYDLLERIVSGKTSRSVAYTELGKKMEEAIRIEHLLSHELALKMPDAVLVAKLAVARKMSEAISLPIALHIPAHVAFTAFTRETFSKLAFYIENEPRVLELVYHEYFRSGKPSHMSNSPERRKLYYAMKDSWFLWLNDFGKLAETHGGLVASLFKLDSGKLLLRTRLRLWIWNLLDWIYHFKVRIIKTRQL